MTQSFTLHDLPAEERPRERLVQHGAHALSAQELLQLILGRGVRGESVAVTAQKLLTQFGSLQKLGESSIDELSSVKGIGLAKAAQLKAAFELSRRAQNQTAAYTSKELTSPEQVFRLVKSKLQEYRKEHFFLISLNSRSNVINEISIGTVNASLAHPREIFSEAIKTNATSVILSHNHPSGDPEPSEEDVAITKQLVEAGKILGIEVTDHVIVTKDDYYSFKEHGQI